MFSRKPKNQDAASDSGVFYPAQVYAYGSSAEGAVYIYVRNDQKVLEVPREYLTYFSSLNGGKTIREHFEEGVKRYGEEAGSHFQSLLPEFINLGLLRRGSKLFNNNPIEDGPLGQPGSSGEGISSFGVITCERPECLDKALRSYITGIQKVESNLRLYVFDDSQKASSLECNREIISAVEADLNVSIQHVDGLAKKQFLRSLQKRTTAAGVPPEVVEFALCCGDNSIPSASGQNRNYYLLFTAGEKAVSADDDTLYEPRGSLQESDSVSITSRSVPNRIDYFLDTPTLEENVSSLPYELLGEYNRMLGVGLREYIEAHSENNMNPGMADMSSAFGCRIEREEPVITLAMTGHYGDSGIGSPFGVLFLEGEQRNRLYSTPEIYESVKRSRTINRYVTNSTLFDSPYFFGPCIGTDHRELLPPFSPLGKNDDVFFAHVFRACFPNNIIGMLPVSVKHSPPESRLIKEERFEDTNFDALHIIMYLINTIEKTMFSSDPRKRMNALGRGLIEAGSLAPEDFAEQLRFLIMAQVDSINKYIDYLLKKYDYKPDYWVDDIERYL